MKKIAELFAANTDSNTVRDLERSLSQTEAAQAKAIAELESLSGGRVKALEDNDEAALAALRQRRPILEDQRDRLALVISETRKKLANARSTQRLARLAEHRAAHAAAVQDYLKVADTGLRAFDAIVGVRVIAIREGFASDVAAMELPPNLNGNAVLSRELLDTFGKSPSLVTSVRPQARKTVVPKPRTTDSQRMVRVGELAISGRTPRTPVREDAHDGTTLVNILKPGVDLPGRAPLGIGDEVAVSADTALMLVRSGAADYVPVAVIDPPTPLITASEVAHV